MASATGFYSTACDVVRYAAAHFHGDDRLITDDTKRQMQRTEWPVEGTGGTEYGLGLAISTIGERRVLGHGGGYPGHITRTYFDPVDKLAVCVMTNAIDGPALAFATAGVKLIDMALGQRDDPADETLDQFTGRFANLWGVFDIVQLGGRLFQIDPTLPDPTVGAVHLTRVDGDTLKMTRTSGYGSFGERLEYRRATDGTITSVPRRQRHHLPPHRDVHLRPRHPRPDHSEQAVGPVTLGNSLRVTSPPGDTRSAGDTNPSYALRHA